MVITALKARRTIKLSVHTVLLLGGIFWSCTDELKVHLDGTIRETLDLLHSKS